MDKRVLARKAGKLAVKTALLRTPQGRAALMAHRLGKLALRARQARRAERSL